MLFYLYFQGNIKVCNKSLQSTFTRANYPSNTSPPFGDEAQKEGIVYWLAASRKPGLSICAFLCSLYPLRVLPPAWWSSLQTRTRSAPSDVCSRWLDSLASLTPPSPFPSAPTALTHMRWVGKQRKRKGNVRMLPSITLLTVLQSRSNNSFL